MSEIKWPAYKEIPKESGLPSSVYWKALGANAMLDACRAAVDKARPDGVAFTELLRSWDGGEISLEEFYTGCFGQTPREGK